MFSRGVFLSCIISMALLACSGNVRPVARPMPPSTDSVSHLLTVMGFDLAVAQLVRKVDASTRAAMTGVLERRNINAEQRRVFDEMEDQVIGVIDYEFSWDRFGPVMIESIQAAYTQEDVDACTRFFQSPAGREISVQLPQAMQDLASEIMKTGDGNVQPEIEQGMEVAMAKAIASQLSPSARNATAAFGKTPAGRDLVARMPEWEKQFDVHFAVLKADADRRMRAVRDEYIARIRATSAAR
jgi:uncharacterized protein